MPRIDGRKNDELRTVEIIPNINKFAEGSCLIRCGNTHVLCTASVEDRPPRHVPEGEGWVTAEYSMLPRANRERSRRDISKLKLNGRSAEIQRLIGRCSALCGGHEEAGTLEHHHRLRRAPGGRRDPHRLHHRRLCGHDAGLPRR